MTDYKQLCAELVDELEGWVAYGDEVDIADAHLLIDRARDALAEPTPEGPADEELDELFTEIDQSGEPESWRVYARAALARWCNRQGIFDSSTPQPVPVSERLPLPGDCDEEGRCWWWYPEVPGKTYGYWAYEDDAVPERALNEQPTHWLSVHALPQPS